MRSYPQFSEEFVWMDLPIIRGWAYAMDALDKNPWIGAKRGSKGYVGQEIDALVKVATYIPPKA